MIGCIITGHGSFAPGLKGALEMIAGEQEVFEAVPFLEDDTVEQFEETLKKTINTMILKVDGVIIFSDLMGGTPFKTAMIQTLEKENIVIFTGTNMPLLMETIGRRLEPISVENLSKKLNESDDCKVQMISLDLNESIDEDIISDGI